MRHLPATAMSRHNNHRAEPSDRFRLRNRVGNRTNALSVLSEYEPIDLLAHVFIRIDLADVSAQCRHSPVESSSDMRARKESARRPNFRTNPGQSGATTSVMITWCSAAKPAARKLKFELMSAPDGKSASCIVRTAGKKRGRDAIRGTTGQFFVIKCEIAHTCRGRCVIETHIHFDKSRIIVSTCSPSPRYGQACLHAHAPFRWGEGHAVTTTRRDARVIDEHVRATIVVERPAEMKDF
jgi:hypothetical protein